MKLYLTFIIVWCTFVFTNAFISSSSGGTTSYSLTDSQGSFRTFDGIGGISGGGATSVLLRGYPPKQRSEILDFLFLPNFGASLHILKVEIGGDAQSTDGSEASHMHDPSDENYQRGYEWWLMKEAKKRNPKIKLYGLPWAYPMWLTCVPLGGLTNCSGNIYANPQATASYIVKWISAAKTIHGLDIDYIGCWNERNYNANYLKVLRKALDDAGFTSTLIVAADGSWGISEEIANDSELARAVAVIGAHYPGTSSSQTAKDTQKPLWASEDDSTYNNNVGAECWARILNRNFVNGEMTGSIIWNVLAAYMKGTNWYRAGLMSAMQPWTGSYGTWRADGSWTVGPEIWATAHTTQFVEPGWSYLGLGSNGGSGELKYGGSYVTFKDFASGEFSIVIEKLSRDHSTCVRPYLPGFETEVEDATFILEGALANVSELYVWKTHFAYYEGDKTYEFERMKPVPVSNGTFSIHIDVDSIITLTTQRDAGRKGDFGYVPPLPTLFPEVHTDDFNTCPKSSEAEYFSDQNGAWECVPRNDSSLVGDMSMRQMVPLRPVTWAGDVKPHSLIGHRDAKNMSLIIDAMVEKIEFSVVLGLRMQNNDNSQGILFCLEPSTNDWGVWTSLSSIGSSSPIVSGTNPVKIQPWEWNQYRIDVNGSKLNVWINGETILQNFDVSNLTMSGHGLIGTAAYGHFTQFDNLQIYSQYTTCGGTSLEAGAPVGVVECNSEVGPSIYSQWVYSAAPNSKNGSNIALRANKSLCLAAVPQEDNNPWWLQLAVCNSSDPNQIWAWDFDGIAPDHERPSIIYLKGSNRCLDIYNELPEIGAQMNAWPCNTGSNQAFWYDFDSGELGNEATATCVGVC